MSLWGEQNEAHCPCTEKLITFRRRLLKLRLGHERKLKSDGLDLES